MKSEAKILEVLDQHGEMLKQHEETLNRLDGKLNNLSDAFHRQEILNEKRDSDIKQILDISLYLSREFIKNGDMVDKVDNHEHRIFAI